MPPFLWNEGRGFYVFAARSPMDTRIFGEKEATFYTMVSRRLAITSALILLGLIYAIVVSLPFES
jgi:hypothetical protein